LKKIADFDFVKPMPERVAEAATGRPADVSDHPARSNNIAGQRFTSIDMRVTKGNGGAARRIVGRDAYGERHTEIHVFVTHSCIWSGW
jgi:hypothetical protein